MERARRTFLKTVAAGAAVTWGPKVSARSDAEELFQIALDPWSLRHDLVFERPDHEPFEPLEYPGIARGLGFDAVMHDNLHFPGKMPDETYVQEMKARCDDAGVRSVLMLLGVLGAIPPAVRALRLPIVDGLRAV